MFAANAAVLVGAAVVLAVAPVTVSWPVSLGEIIVLGVGLLVMLVLNFVLLRRILTPLRRLRQAIATVQPLGPREPIDVGARSIEVAALTSAFNDMLERLDRERRQSSRRAQSAQEQERRALSLELHDQIGQNLTALLLQLDLASRSAANPEQRTALEASIETVRECLDQVRAIVRRLRPEALDDLGLVGAIGHLCDRFESDTGMSVERSCDSELPRLTSDAQLVVYRVAQESLTNAARHSGAAGVSVALMRHDDGVRLAISDNGVGPPTVGHDGSGIRGMRERALMVGARLDVGRLAPRGTRVVLDVPREEVRA